MNKAERQFLFYGCPYDLHNKGEGQFINKGTDKPPRASFKRSDNNYCLPEKGGKVATWCRSQIRLRTSQSML